jgi:hypothetical protein
VFARFVSGAQGIVEASEAERRGERRGGLGRSGYRPPGPRCRSSRTVSLRVSVTSPPRGVHAGEFPLGLGDPLEVEYARGLPMGSSTARTTSLLRYAIEQLAETCRQGAPAGEA